MLIFLVLIKLVSSSKALAWLNIAKMSSFHLIITVSLQVLEDMRKTVSKLGRSLDEVVASTPRCALEQINHKFGRHLFHEGLEGAKIPCMCLFHSNTFDIHMFQSLGNWTSRLDQGGS